MPWVFHDDENKFLTFNRTFCLPLDVACSGVVDDKTTESLQDPAAGHETMACSLFCEDYRKNDCDEPKIDPLVVEEQRIIARHLKKMKEAEDKKNAHEQLSHLESICAPFKPKQKERKENRSPEGTICPKCHGRVDHSLQKLKFGRRDRNRKKAVCDGRCLLKMYNRNGKCRVCRKVIKIESRDRKFCNGLCEK